MVPRLVHVGWHLAVALREPVADLGCYVGEIQAVDEFGVRLTLIDWFTGMFSGYDFLIPWSNVLSAIVVTDKHDLEGWDPGKFQTRHETMRKQALAREVTAPDPQGPEIAR